MKSRSLPTSHVHAHPLGAKESGRFFLPNPIYIWTPDSAYLTLWLSTLNLCLVLYSSSCSNDEQVALGRPGGDCSGERSKAKFSSRLLFIPPPLTRWLVTHDDQVSLSHLRRRHPTLTDPPLVHDSDFTPHFPTVNDSLYLPPSIFTLAFGPILPFFFVSKPDICCACGRINHFVPDKTL